MTTMNNKTTPSSSSSSRRKLRPSSLSRRTLLRRVVACLVTLSCVSHNGIRPVRPFAPPVVVVIPTATTTGRVSSVVAVVASSDRRRQRDARGMKGLRMNAAPGGKRSDPEPPEEKKKDDDENVDDRVEEFLAMQEASRRVTNRLMMPRKVLDAIGQTIRFVAIAFLVVSYGLQFAGYALIRDNDSIRIGTLNDQAFQMEVTKSVKDK
eukprot:CAMPEP_0197179476 /NCGR_PEP_ID=MMETSP1423-20130617/4408_1 /TAXON_ID=476441 /ORGANISM="Pseudo-nitzschia heimii, Strain UNC1101" /LENGTH=207 /DNA_ID=CAMNT_0042629387 /DNA_START=283 /DNA_END=906 /DNA_ORIENTATION=+